MSLFSSSFLIIAISTVIYGLFFGINEFLFSHLNFSTGVNWIFLPAGMRLLLALIFSFEGAIGISIASVLISLFFYFQHDPITGIGAGVLGGLAPYLARYIVFKNLPITTQLDGLNASRLMSCMIIFSVISPLLHQFWFVSRGMHNNFFNHLFVMMVGDFTGTLIIVFFVKVCIYFLRAHSQPHK